MSKDDRAVKRRKYQAGYRARHAPVLREKGQRVMREERATARAAKRRWDPPRRGPSVRGDNSAELVASSISGSRRPPETRSASAESRRPDPRGMSMVGPPDEEDQERLREAHAAVANSRHFADCASAASPTSEERIAIEALATLGQPRTPREHPASEGSVLEKAMLLSSSRKSLAGIQLRPMGSASPWVTHALQEVSALNSEPPTPPTAFDRTFWTRTDRHLFQGRFLTQAVFQGVRLWRLREYHCRRKRLWRSRMLENESYSEDDNNSRCTE
ncbi:hypothetical protein C8R47DRAFT_1229544 [Mycena vitilis]|nr:hypothetical protein C8R47DRAFT_1229544 [Mycena vitilis]